MEVMSATTGHKSMNEYDVHQFMCAEYHRREFSGDKTDNLNYP